MNPGELRQRVTLQRPGTPTPDAMGGRSVPWANVGTTWAHVEPLEGNERLRAMQVSPRLSHRITMRYRPGVTSAMRVLYGARVFGLRSVIDPDERHERLVLLAEEVG